MSIELIAKARRFLVGKAGLSPIIARATGIESLAMAQVESAHAQSTIAGDRFQISLVTAIPTGVTSVVAQITTAPHWVIWNNDYQKSYIFDTLGMLIVSGTLTAGSGVLIQCCLFQAPAQTGASTSADLVVTSCSNGGPSSKAILKTGVTITTPAAPIWYTIAKNDTTNIAASLQPSIAAINRDVRGRIVVPPQQGLGLSAYSTATGTPKFVP